MSLLTSSAIRFLERVGVWLVEAIEGTVGGVVPRFCQVSGLYQVIVSLGLIALSYVCLRAFSKARR